VSLANPLLALRAVLLVEHAILGRDPTDAAVYNLDRGELLCLATLGRPLLSGSGSHLLFLTAIFLLRGLSTALLALVAPLALLLLLHLQPVLVLGLPLGLLVLLATLIGLLVLLLFFLFGSSSSSISWL
jgi:hypothetical protein